MRGYQPILGSRRRYVFKNHFQFSYKIVKIHTIIVNSNTTSQMSLQSVQISTTTLSVRESSLVSQYLDFCQALARMGQTIPFSLTLGSTFYFNLGTNLLHLNHLSNYVPCNSQIINIVKKTTYRSTFESPDVPIKETTIESVHIKAPYIPLMSKDKLHA